MIATTLKRRASVGVPSTACLYFGTVEHRRHAPRTHRFKYQTAWLYSDPETWDEAFRGRWFWSGERRNLVTMRRGDYFGDPRRSIRDEVFDRVELEGGRRPTGGVRILTTPRVLGVSFNPVSFYYCFDQGGVTPVAILAEITNTPWGERHAYVLGRAPGGSPTAIHRRFPKEFHVSPFFGMDHVYDWAFTPPGNELCVHMTNRREGSRVFDVHLRLARRPLDAKHAAWMLLRTPWAPVRTLACIYTQALRLYLKRTPFHTHPSKTPEHAGGT